MDDMPKFEVHVVPHTHWDREWYLPAARFRQRLVALIDELLDASDAPTFLLDGQTIVLEDYLAIRPERAAELGTRLRAGTLEAGPWYVLADELIPSGEALVRNLLAGRRTLRALRAEPPPVLYCPDAFGHPAALPLLARGFGCDMVIVWRGLGGQRWPPSDTLTWRAPDGTAVLVYHLPREGYSIGANLPVDEHAARSRWQALRSEMAPRARLGALLLPNGGDHHALQRHFRTALAALERAASPDRVVASSLRCFADAAAARSATAPLPEICGELRDSYGYTWTLQGTLATRAHQKRRNALVERLLLRDAEPWSALARLAGRPSRRHLLQAAWRSLLQCHPHDTLCGCSIDDVARAMDARMDETDAQARGIRHDCMLDLLGHDPVRARMSPAEWQPAIVVRNRAARPRGGVAEVEMLEFLRHVPVGPGSGVMSPPNVPAVGAAIPQHVQVLRRTRRHDRTESPAHFPDDDLVASTQALIWVPPLDGYAVRGFALDSSLPAPPASFGRAGGKGTTIWNDALELRVDRDGVVALRTTDGAREIASLVRFACIADIGDLYTHSPVGEPSASATLLGVRSVYRGPLRATVEARWRLPVPRPPETGTRSPGDRRSPWRERRRTTVIAVRFTLDAGSSFLRMDVTGENRAPNHRLRVAIGTDIAGGDVFADAAFGPVQRSPIVASEPDRAMETPPPTAPLHRYVSRFAAQTGATLYSDGLAEYEAMSDGAIAVTLVRAVGELSRSTLPERPGHAGWPVRTPAAQSIGPFAAALGLLLHGGRNAAAIDAIERAADDLLLPLIGGTLRSALAVPDPTPGVELRGEGLVFSTMKESEDGAWVVLRCYNATAALVHGTWRLPRAIEDARSARLDETPLDPLPANGRELRFTAAGHAVVTILVR